MSLGMMMMLPVVCPPCKLLLFVLVDGWHMISRAVVTSFGPDDDGIGIQLQLCPTQ